MKKRENVKVFVEDINAEMERITREGTNEERQQLINEIETAYLEKEIERMYDRLARAGRDTSIVSDKLSQLKSRKKNSGIK